MEIEGVVLDLPPFVEELRPHQVEAITEIVKLLGDRKVVFLDAPTGAGKTIIGECARQIVRSSRLLNLRKALYVCTTKSLQEQFLHDFTYAKVIKGRANYPTFDSPSLFDERGARHLDASHCTKVKVEYEDLPLCDQCYSNDADIRMWGLSTHDEQTATLRHCFHCHPWQYCPYEVAKNEALSAQLAVANTAYFLTEANYVGRFGRDVNTAKAAFPFTIIDEADTVEGVVMGHVEVSFPKAALQKYGLGVPTKKTVPTSWLEWAVKAQGIMEAEVERLGTDISAYKNDPPPIGAKREIERAETYLGKLSYLVRSLRLEPENWVYDGYDEGRLVMKPVRVASHARDLLWRHSDKFLLMSATVISPDQMADDLGLTDGEWGFVEVDSNFPAERRPIRVLPRANMTNKTKVEEWPKMIAAVSQVLDLHPSERVLIHTVSYEWTRALMEGLNRTEHRHRLLTYSDGKERESILGTYKNRPNAVLLAPSLDRGIDLPYDLCRCIIITKVPFPNLGDKQINKRFFGTGQAGKSWYYTETVRSLVQMTGRGMRSADDYCVTYLLDSQFASNVWTNPVSRNRMPRWWVRALSWDAPRRSATTT